MARILIVEYYFSLRRVLTMHLVRQGHGVAEADSVASAREILLAASDPFDVMLLDINLPDGSGWEVLRQQEQTRGEAHSRVIVMTALPPTPHQQRRFQPAATLLKPFPLSTLLRLIDLEIACPAEAASRDTATRPDRERVRSLARYGHPQEGADARDFASGHVLRQAVAHRQACRLPAIAYGGLVREEP